MPGLLLRRRFPPCASTNARDTYRPRPAPWNRRDRLPSSCVNGSNTRPKSAAGDANPGIGDLEEQISVLVQSRAHGHGSAGLGELHGVREQVVQHLLKPALIRLQNGKIVRNLDREE